MGNICAYFRGETKAKIYRNGSKYTLIHLQLEFCSIFRFLKINFKCNINIKLCIQELFYICDTKEEYKLEIRVVHVGFIRSQKII